MNTGEGGLSPYHLEGGGDIVFQIGTAKYGVRDDRGALDEGKLARGRGPRQVRMFEIKLSQGAKPGKGGILPAAKVTAEVAAIRGIPAGKDSLSPSRHPDIDGTGDLLDMVGRVRRVTGKPTGFKLVLGEPAWLDDLCEEILRRGLDAAPDFITVDSADGGTGAAPLSLIDNVGLPIQESLPLVVDALSEHGLRDRVRVVASGKLITPADVAWALSRRRRLRQHRARVHVRARLHSVDAVQQEHLRRPASPPMIPGCSVASTRRTRPSGCGTTWRT